MALELKETARTTLADLISKACALSQELELPDSTEETQKAHSDAQKKALLFVAELMRREAEIVALDEEDKVVDFTLEALKNL